MRALGGEAGLEQEGGQEAAGWLVGWAAGRAPQLPWSPGHHMTEGAQTKEGAGQELGVTPFV